MFEFGGGCAFPLGCVCTKASDMLALYRFSFVGDLCCRPVKNTTDQATNTIKTIMAQSQVWCQWEVKNNERDFPKRSDAGDQKNFVLFLTCTTRGKGELAGSSPALNDLLSNKQGQLLYRYILHKGKQFNWK